LYRRMAGVAAIFVVARGRPWIDSARGLQSGGPPRRRESRAERASARFILQPSVETVTDSQALISLSSADNLFLASPSASLAGRRCVGGGAAPITASIARAAFRGSPGCWPLLSSRAFAMTIAVPTPRPPVAQHVTSFRCRCQDCRRRKKAPMSQ